MSNPRIFLKNENISQFQIFINQNIYIIILNQKEWMQKIDIIDLNFNKLKIDVTYIYIFGMNFDYFTNV